MRLLVNDVAALTARARSGAVSRVSLCVDKRSESDRQRQRSRRHDRRRASVAAATTTPAVVASDRRRRSTRRRRRRDADRDRVATGRVGRRQRSLVSPRLRAARQARAHLYRIGSAYELQVGAQRSVFDRVGGVAAPTPTPTIAFELSITLTHVVVVVLFVLRL